MRTRKFVKSQTSKLESFTHFFFHTVVLNSFEIHTIREEQICTNNTVVSYLSDFTCYLYFNNQPYKLIIYNYNFITISTY